ncbi:zinc finger MYM-type protein 1-like [Asparagus officinalis]|uniref:zinc finger MYM-type protein 1-like n=1 Tax=Asparagus officinalis TaxID=4686 RepID=UPI00098E4A28|nr:zinc finger MYM-type protein 1-like [Asparagus officinalis]
MRGEFNGLQTLIMKDCKTAYYVHCFAHRLQLALVAAAKNLTPIHIFFDKLISIVNMVGASCKRNDELKKAHADDIAHLISINELETGPGLNQISTLQQASNTRWSSHFRSLSSLIRMFSAACTVLLKVMEDGLPSQRADATSVYDEMTSFDFVLILHLMSEIMGITDFFCQTLQRKSQDISNAMKLVSSTKRLLQELRDDKWDNLLEKVKSFCAARNINIPDFSAQCVDRRRRARGHQDITIGHHYRTNKSATYDLIFRVTVLVLTLPVSTATAERSFSAMNIVKTRLRSKMEDAFLSDALMVFIEREIAKSLSIDAIIEDFENFKERRIPFS